jgi:colanic acid/amylovoran biosynthesis glycosyltransferase
MAEPEKLRLLVVGVAWPPETFLANLLRGLLQAGMQVTLSTGRRPDLDWLSQPGFTWLRAPGWKGTQVEKLVRLAGLAARGVLSGRGDLPAFAGHIRQNGRLRDRLALWSRLLPYAGRRWDVIYFPWNSAAIEHLPLFDLGMPVVMSCRGAQINIAPHNPERAWIRDGIEKTFSQAAAVHCVSEAILQEAAGLGLDARKARVIRPAVDARFFAPAAVKRSDDQTYRIITTGSLIWRKGYEYALEAVRSLKDMGIPVRFEIVGDGQERQRLLYTIYDLDLVENVDLSGRLSPEKVRERLQQADVFLLSSLSEGISNAALEAMACGLPVVTTNCGGMGEAITDGVEGFVVPSRDPQAIASALSQLWLSHDLGEQMGQAGRRRSLAEFTLGQQIEGFVQLYRSVAGSSILL